MIVREKLLPSAKKKTRKSDSGPCDVYATTCYPILIQVIIQHNVLCGTLCRMPSSTF